MMSKMTKEQFVEKCDSNIKLMSSVSDLSFDECAEAMFATYNGFADAPDEDVNRIVDELNKIGNK